MINPGNGSSPTASYRMMTYSHDGFGMGHLRRNINVTSRFMAEEPGATALMMVGCSPESYFDLPEGIDFIKLPSIVKVATGVHRPASLRISLEQAKALRSSMIQQAAEVYRPDLLLVDHVPAGVWGELLPTLEKLKERPDPPVIVLGMREFMDAPEVIREHWHREGTYDVINRYYDAVLIYGCREIFDTVRVYSLDRELRTRIHYCGYVLSEEAARPKEEVRAELLANEGEKLLVVIGGGGRDAYPMMRACIEAIPLVQRQFPISCALVAGPLMASSEKESLREEACARRIRFLSHVHGNLSYLNAADFVVTMAGYNSVTEILRLRKRALVIPRLGPSAEQTMRAELFANRRLIDAVSPKGLSPERLARRICFDLEREDFPVEDPLLDMNGAERAAASLMALAGERTIVAPLDYAPVSPVHDGLAVAQVGGPPSPVR